MYSLKSESYEDWYEECLNTLIPECLGDLSRKYNLRYKPVSVTEIAMYNEHCCLILGLDIRDGVILMTDVNENGKRVEYSTNIFFRVSIDDSDKEGVDLNVHHFLEKARRDFIILSRNLNSKWSNYLQGDMSWLEDYKKCDSFYVYQNYMDERNRLLDEIIAWQQEQKTAVG